MFTAAVQISRADIFQLRAGGQLTGTTVERGEQGEYFVCTDEGARITLSRRQVERVISKDDTDLVYEQRSRTMPDTAEAHRAMADWCKENRLTKLARHHRRRVIELDPNDEAARLSLGYQFHRGRWLTRNEMMAARGMRKYDGDFRTPQDIALRDRTKRRETAEAEWLRQIRIWVSWLNKRRQVEAIDAIGSIEDPLATKALVQQLEKARDPRIHNLLLAKLAELRHPLAVTTLVDYSLNDSDRETRLQCLEYLLQYHAPINLEPYVKSLDPRKNNNITINRAAEALARIGDPRAISPLIDALVTTHKFKNRNAPPGNMNPTFRSGGGASGGGLNMGGQKDKIVLDDLQNLKVRQALVELSGGQDYEFDEELWRMWFVNEQIDDYVDTRRDL